MTDSVVADLISLGLLGMALAIDYKTGYVGFTEELVAFIEHAEQVFEESADEMLVDAVTYLMENR